jgi:hypothetical protein
VFSVYISDHLNGAFNEAQSMQNRSLACCNEGAATHLVNILAEVHCTTAGFFEENPRDGERGWYGHDISKYDPGHEGCHNSEMDADEDTHGDENDDGDDGILSWHDAGEKCNAVDEGDDDGENEELGGDDVEDGTAVDDERIAVVSVENLECVGNPDEGERRDFIDVADWIAKVGEPWSVGFEEGWNFSIEAGAAVGYAEVSEDVGIEGHDDMACFREGEHIIDADAGQEYDEVDEWDYGDFGDFDGYGDDDDDGYY